MIKIKPTDRVMRRVAPKVAPAAKTPTFFTELPKSNPVIKHSFVARIGFLKNVGYGMNIMEWVDKRTFTAGAIDISVNLAKEAAFEMMRNIYIGLPTSTEIREEVVYADGKVKSDILFKWELKGNLVAGQWTQIK